MLLIIFARLNGGLTMNIRELRNMFPALSRTVYGKPLVYFDNAATAQRPVQPGRRVANLLRFFCRNPGRYVDLRGFQCIFFLIIKEAAG